MRAMVYRGPYKVRVEENGVPSLEHPNDAIVRVTLAAICGSDIHLYHGLMPDTRVGHTFGHEFIGVVEEVGPSVRNLNRGDRVMVPFNVFCGSCFFCARGLYSNCHNVNPNATAVGGIYGYSHTCGGYDGSQAEFVRVPFRCRPQPHPRLDGRRGRGPADRCAAHGLLRGAAGRHRRRRRGRGFRCRGGGALRRQVVRAHGRREGHRHRPPGVPARQGAGVPAHAETYNFTEYNDIVVHMKKITDHLGADVAIDAAGAGADGNFIQHLAGAKLKLQGGSAVALNWAIDSVRKAGTVSVIGAYGPIFSAVKFGDAFNKGLTLRMNQCPVKRQWPRLFEHIRNGYLKPRDVVTHRMPLEHIAEGYHMSSAKLDDCIKPLVVPDAS